MKSDPTDRDPGLLKSVSAAYLILLLHLLLLAGMILMVIFFRGVVQYMFWIFAAGALLLIGSGAFFYRRMRAQGRTLGEMIRSPDFAGRSIEVSFLGGLASFRLGQPQRPMTLGTRTIGPEHQLEDPASARIKQLKELADLLEKDLITIEEYDRTKKQMFLSTKPTPPK
jgi:hypothetical protein